MAHELSGLEIQGRDAVLLGALLYSFSPAREELG